MKLQVWCDPRGVGEPLVVTEVEVGLRSVVGDEDLAVLQRVHRAGVDVDVRVELEEVHAETSGLHDGADRAARDAFAERRDDAAGDEYELLTALLGRHEILGESSLAHTR